MTLDNIKLHNSVSIIVKVHFFTHVAKDRVSKENVFDIQRKCKKAILE